MAITRIGHKGADALVPGNTIASFEKAVEVGVDVIEFDVLWLEGRVAAQGGRARQGEEARQLRGASDRGA